MRKSFQRCEFQKYVKVSRKLGKWLMFLVIFSGLVVLLGHSMSQDAVVKNIPMSYRCPTPCPVLNCDPLPPCNPLGIQGQIGSQGGEKFGFSVAGSKDLNCDGYADVVVGAPLYTKAEPNALYNGRVVVFYGSPTGISYTTGRFWEKAGHTMSRFGYSCAIGDVDANGDGRYDLIVGAPFYREESTGPIPGAVYIFLQEETGFEPEPTILTGELTGGEVQTRTEFGCAVASVGNVDGVDGDEILVGSQCYTNFDNPDLPIYYVGKVYLYGMKDGSIQKKWSFEGTVGNTYLGASVASAGDVNADGLTDIIIGAPMAGNGTGIVYVFYNTGDPDNPYGASPSWYANGDNHTQFGKSVACAGKVKGSTSCDAIIIGAPNWSVNGKVGAGKAFIYYGQSGGLGNNNKPADVTIAGQNEYDNLGTTVGCAGHVNNYEYDDVFVGVPGYGKYDDGAAFIYYGSYNGLITPSTCQIESAPNHYKMGTSACSAGDINGDCTVDIVLGGPNYREGLFTVYYGSREIHCYNNYY